LNGAEPLALTTFDEWRGGVGLSLAIARRIINAHGGSIWSPVEESKAGAVIALPLA
jgi:signal transduction histidine kinase